MSEPRIKAIETRYKGYRFRSRLEARWAVYFDHLKLKWEYEKEGFDFGDGVFYLPDFWLPQVRMWMEVKPESLTEAEMGKAFSLARATGRGVGLLVGVPDCKSYDLVLPPCGTADCEKTGKLCHTCGATGGEPLVTDFVISNYHGYPITEHRFFSATGGLRPSDFDDSGAFDDVPAAVEAARSARFEHGESPR